MLNRLENLKKGVEKTGRFIKRREIIISTSMVIALGGFVNSIQYMGTVDNKVDRVYPPLSSELIIDSQKEILVFEKKIEEKVMQRQDAVLISELVDSSRLREAYRAIVSNDQNEKNREVLRDKMFDVIGFNRGTVGIGVILLGGSLAIGAASSRHKKSSR